MTNSATILVFIYISTCNVFADQGDLERIKRVLPINVNCNPRVSTGANSCVKGDWVNASIADCERNTTLGCTAMDAVSGYHVVEPAVGSGCIPTEDKMFKCEAAGTNTRCVCSSDSGVIFSSNACKCQYWPAAEPGPNKPCIGYYLGEDTGQNEWACCAESTCCMSHTWQYTTTNPSDNRKCDTNGRNTVGSARIKYYFSCGTDLDSDCSLKWGCEMKCNKGSSVFTINKDQTWLNCFKDCCLKNVPRRKREDGTCGDGTCSGNETPTSCPVDCCQQVNSACIRYGNECRPQCCQEAKCCSSTVIMVYSSIIMLLSVLCSFSAL